jgi:hypothetical protein
LTVRINLNSVGITTPTSSNKVSAVSEDLIRQIKGSLAELKAIDEEIEKFLAHFD